MDRGEQLMSALWDMMNKKRALDQSQLKGLAEDLNATELRCIDYVGRHSSVNATRLAEAFYMTTGAASKLTKKLLAKGLLLRYQKLENRKEVYFRLTEQGEVLFAALAEIREKIARRDESVFAALPDAQYESFLRFARSYSDHLDLTAHRSARRDLD